jgi:hypothetical protein
MGNTTIAQIKIGGSRACLKWKAFGTLKNVMIFTPIHIKYLYMYCTGNNIVHSYVHAETLKFLNYNANDVQLIIGIYFALYFY